MRVYESPFESRRKADRSPVTEADEAAERLILAGLARLAPSVPVVAEESMAAGRGSKPGAARFFLVDPLDGTKEFIARNGEFTVNIGLIEDGRPVAGVVHAPATGESYWAADGHAWCQSGPMRARRAPAAGLTALVSRSHNTPETEAWCDRHGVAERRVAGSSLKLCHIACGLGDANPRFGPTHEWDTAAAHAILLAAGGSVRDMAGRELTYGKPGYRNPPYVARGLDRA